MEVCDMSEYIIGKNNCDKNCKVGVSGSGKSHIIGTGDSGKTRKLLEQAKKSGATVVCEYPLHMQNKSNSYGIYGLEFLSYEEFMTDMAYGKRIVIDEIGKFFKCRFGVELDSSTMTID